MSAAELVGVLTLGSDFWLYSGYRFSISLTSQGTGGIRFYKDRRITDRSKTIIKLLLPHPVRTAPGTSNSTVQANLPGGAPFRVIEGPRCVEGYNWWRITTGSITGWTAEGDWNEYWLEPSSP